MTAAEAGAAGARDGSRTTFPLFVTQRGHCFLLLRLTVFGAKKPRSDAKVCKRHSRSRAVYMAQCRCRVDSTAPPTLPAHPDSLKVYYALQKKKKNSKNTQKNDKGSIIFYRSSPVALTRERGTSYPESRRCCPSLSDVVPSPGFLVVVVSCGPTSSPSDIFLRR